MTHLFTLTELILRKAIIRDFLFQIKSLPAFQDGKTHSLPGEALIVKHVQEELTFVKRHWTELRSGRVDDYNIYFWRFYSFSYSLRIHIATLRATVHMCIFIVLDLHLNLSLLLLNTWRHLSCSSAISNITHILNKPVQFSVSLSLSPTYTPSF